MLATKLITLSAAVLLSTAALAGDKDKGSMKSADQQFESLDENQDRQISKSEAQNDETLSATFASIDADSDGYVSEREYTASLSTEEQEPQSSDDY
jgi:Ca2+-binding EF-hand superfamily protein